MAAKKTNESPSDQDASPVYVLEQNFGAIINGAHKFWESGTEFLAEKESDLIAYLHRAGAAIKLKL